MLLISKILIPSKIIGNYRQTDHIPYGWRCWWGDHCYVILSISYFSPTIMKSNSPNKAATKKGRSTALESLGHSSSLLYLPPDIPWLAGVQPTLYNNNSMMLPMPMMPPLHHQYQQLLYQQQQHQFVRICISRRSGDVYCCYSPMVVQHQRIITLLIMAVVKRGCAYLVNLAGNVLIWNVFPSLHLQTCCVVSRHVADTSLVMSATQRHCMLARVSKRHDIWRHVATFDDMLWHLTT
jgi:hypothetical protein